jgi:hypothetical protein
MFVEHCAISVAGDAIVVIRCAMPGMGFASVALRSRRLRKSPPGGPLLGCRVARRGSCGSRSCRSRGRRCRSGRRRACVRRFGAVCGGRGGFSGFGTAFSGVVIDIPAGALEAKRGSGDRANQIPLAFRAGFFRFGAEVLDFLEAVAALGTAIFVEWQA